MLLKNNTNRHNYSVMPELPEVETIKRGLESAIIHQRISGVEVLWWKSFDVPEDLVNQAVVGARIKALRRRAKVLLWDLDNDYSLLFHLKMTGQLVLTDGSETMFAGGHPSESMIGDRLPDRSTRVIFSLESGEKLYFNDQRKFGWIKLIPTAEVDQEALLARLGPEPLSDEFTLAGFKAELLAHKGAPIKAVILDQSTVSGVGNIYADESLHLAKVHPARLAGSLSETEAKRLHGAIKTIIGLGVEHGGTSFSHFVNVMRGKGDYLQHARVFKREGQSCPVCGTEIEKIRVAGRGTHFCPKCQRLS
jgi:formamidopyrimidine-DNA glycosylase